MQSSCTVLLQSLQATLLGDMVTLVGAISIIGYLEVGQNLRSFMPLMVYAVPVTGELWLTPNIQQLHSRISHSTAAFHHLQILSWRRMIAMQALQH
jgi:hypothetical protein